MYFVKGLYILIFWHRILSLFQKVISQYIKHLLLVFVCSLNVVYLKNIVLQHVYFILSGLIIVRPPLPAITLFIIYTTNYNINIICLVVNNVYYYIPIIVYKYYTYNIYYYNLFYIYIYYNLQYILFILLLKVFLFYKSKP